MNVFKKMKLFSLALLFLSVPLHSAIFTSLDRIQNYAKELNEFPDADNITQLLDWLAPEYRSFHEKNIPGFFSRLLIRIGLKRPVWIAGGFKQLLLNLTKEREAKGYKGRFVRKLIPPHESHFFIWGNLHGVFHSLLRDLQELKRQGIIDDSLKILNKSDYFVFIGNVIDRSPFILETLTLVMQLMHVNPDKVFYIRGDHEDHDKWLNFGLRDELELRAYNVSTEDIPLKSYMRRFFDTLPLALYLATEGSDGSMDLVRISCAGLDNKELQEKKYAAFLSSSADNTVYSLEQKEIKKSLKKVKLKALIRVKRWSISIVKLESWSADFYPSGGLQFIGINNGIVEWAVISSPTNTSRRLFDFHFDSFVELITRKGVNNWDLIVYNRDIREPEAPFKTYTFDLISKEKERPKPKKEEFILEKLMIGTTLDLSSVYKREAAHLEEGMRLAIDQINSDGGIKGRLLELIVLDDGYRQDKARANVLSLLKQGIDIILATWGTPELKGYIDLVKDKKVLAIFPCTGEMFRSEPGLKYILNFFPPYFVEGVLLAEYCIDALGTKKIVFYYNPEAMEDIEAAEIKFKAAGVKSTKIPYVSGEAINKVVNTIKRKNPDSIMFTCPPSAALELIEKLGLSWTRGKHLLGDSSFSDLEFQNFINEKGLSFISTTNMANVATSELPIANEFRKDAQALSIPLSYDSFIGYVLVKVFAYILGQIEEPITKEAIIKVGEQIKNVNFKGLVLDFNPQLRQIFHRLWLDKGKGEREEYHIKVEDKKVVAEKIDKVELEKEKLYMRSKSQYQ